MICENDLRNEIVEIEDKMKKKKSSKILCKDFEIKIENSVKLVQDKVEIKSKEIKEVIIIDDDFEEKFVNLIKKKKRKTEKKKEVRLFGDITSKIQNVHQSQNDSKKSTHVLRSITSHENLILPTNDKNDKQTTEIDLEKTFKILKPENYRIKRVIKQEDLVYFDIETGGMGSKHDILQIGAINYEGKKFNYYVTPTQKIPPISSRIHHITYKENKMYYRKNPIQHQPIFEVLVKFCEYLNETKSKQIVLVAHNANFDRRFLIEKTYLCNLQNRLNDKVIGFLDTLPLFKELLPGKENYRQTNLVLSFFPQTKTDFHNALTDVIYLKKLFELVVANRMKSELKFINSFTQNLEYGFLKKEQQMFEEMSKNKSTKKNSLPMNEPKKPKSSSIFIDGIGVPVKKNTSKIKLAENQIISNEIKCKRLKKMIK